LRILNRFSGWMILAELWPLNINCTALFMIFVSLLHNYCSMHMAIMGRHMWSLITLVFSFIDILMHCLHFSSWHQLMFWFAFTSCFELFYLLFLFLFHFELLSHPVPNVFKILLWVKFRSCYLVTFTSCIELLIYILFWVVYNRNVQHLWPIG
jgi:hypothetical protein